MSDRATGIETERFVLLAEFLVTLADTLVDDFDVVDLLDRLAATCVELLGANAAAILLISPRGEIGVVASSSEASNYLELLQLQNDEGPCLDCIRTGTAVIGADLTAHSGQWPRFATAALEAGYRSVNALPLRLRSQVIGGLNIFHESSVPFSTADQRIARALADTATVGILQQRAIRRGDELAEQLQHALSSRIVIEQAKGMIAEYHHGDMDGAFKLLRAFCRNNNRKLTEAAREITQRVLPLEQLTS